MLIKVIETNQLEFWLIVKLSSQNVVKMVFLSQE